MINVVYQPTCYEDLLQPQQSPEVMGYPSLLQSHYMTSNPQLGQPGQRVYPYLPPQDPNTSSQQLGAYPAPPTYPNPYLVPQMVIINQGPSNNGSMCRFCCRNTPTLSCEVMGRAILGWAMGLCFLTGICCVWIPFVMPDCYDHQYLCAGCNQVKYRVDSKYGC